jgi:hypothetical protein
MAKLKKPKNSIDKVNSMAKERGISYGRMSLILEGYLK